MYLLPREQDKLLLHQAGFLAQKRLARGLRLNINEATALIASQLQEFMRDVQKSDEGEHLVPKLQSMGKKLLGRKHVLDGVAPRLREIQVEGTLPDGVFLVTVEDAICTDDGDIAAALYGSFLPTPPPEAFPSPIKTPRIAPKIPGEIVPGGGDIVLNPGRERIKLKVCNKGDRAIQIGSHYPFADVNECLVFDRCIAAGKRLDIASGTSKRFEPGEPETEVTLVPVAGSKVVKGGNGLTESILSKLAAGISDDSIFKGFGHVPQPDAPLSVDQCTLTRADYISKFGPTVGDRIRLGDTDLWIKIERDAAEPFYGDEVKFGGGKTIRDGMGQACGRSSSDAVDLIITNAVIVDWSGIYKADIGIKGGLIEAIGKSGNPDIMDGVHPKLVIGGSTEVIAGEQLIVTAGAIDVHVHYICPQQINEALAVGTTTMIGGGTGGPSAGTNATTCTPSPFYIETMLAATDGVPMNFAFTGKGSDSGRPALEDVVKAGAAGLKLHEDWGTTPTSIINCLDVADDYDVQVNIHTDSLNESGFVQNTIKAFGDRTIHTYHTEGAGGGHAPDIIVVCELENVLPSSTNPTRPLAVNTIDEHFDMLVACHHLDKNIAEDVAFANSRIRKETVAAEDVLHDTGALSMISSDSQAMGRVGEVISRTWRTADKLKEARGPLTELCDTPDYDNGRVKRYIAKYTINPAITHGISKYVGSIEEGKLADLVLWKPENFGAKPEMVLKSGVIVWAQVGEANASISTVQPAYGRPMWGSYPAAAARNSMAFVSQISIDNGKIESYKLSKRIRPVVGCRKVTKKHMKWNDSLPKLAVDPETFDVYVDGKLADIGVATSVPLGRGYNFF